MVTNVDSYKFFGDCHNGMLIPINDGNDRNDIIVFKASKYGKYGFYLD
jgi:hypothetical protein